MRPLAAAGRVLRILVVIGFAGLLCMGSARSASEPGTAALSTAQIVDRMEQHERAQWARLGSYQALRHYSVEYHSIFKTLTAGMDVEIHYDAASGKSFRIVSESGSHTLCEKVLRRAVESEKEASLNKSATALTNANYRFRMAGREAVNGRSAYILDVDPIVPSKFLYRGKIWVDGAEFAVIKMEVQPGRNPSFWISRTIIHHRNTEVEGFWLPQQNRSETKVRIGGTAVLTIDYGTYRVMPRPAQADVLQ